jgi:creatinine amidohydrolase/Fe(II)-dependent formamide hydrolase-like protein
MTEIEWGRLKAHELRKLAEDDAILIVPIGATEQHGPHLPVMVDYRLAHEVAVRAARLIAEHQPVVVAPVIPYGMSEHHVSLGGTLTLDFATMQAVLDCVCGSAIRQGFRRLFILNGHGGNVATIEAAFSELYAEASFARQPRGYALKLRNWWDLPGVHALANRQFPTGHGSHATPSEIAVTQWAYPDAIKTANYAPQIAPTGPIREALDFRARYPDGRMGSDPGQATPEKGGELVAQAAASLLEDVAANCSAADEAGETFAQARRRVALVQLVEEEGRTRARLGVHVDEGRDRPALALAAAAVEDAAAAARV